jgi:PAS domain S-box-containing protein
MRLIRRGFRASDLLVLAAALAVAGVATVLLVRNGNEVSKAGTRELLITDLLRRENDLYDLSYSLLNGHADPSNVRWVERDVAQQIEELETHHREADLADVFTADRAFRQALSKELELLEAGEYSAALELQRRSIFPKHRAVSRELSAAMSDFDERRSTLSARETRISIIASFVAALGIALVTLIASRSRRDRAAAEAAQLAIENQRLRDQNAIAELVRQVARSAEKTESVPRLLERTIGLVCFFAGWPLGHVWLRGTEGRLEPTNIWHCEETGRFRSFRRATEDMAAAGEEGLAGRAARSGRPEWLDDIGATDLPRAAAARAEGVTASLAFPILSNGEVVAVLEMFTDRPSPAHRALDGIAGALAVQLGEIISRKAVDVERSRLAAIVASTDDSMLTTTPGGRITSWNRAAAEHSGYSAEEIIGRPITVLFPDELQREFGQLLERLERGETVRNFELKLRKRSGELADISVTVTPLGGKRGFAITSRDITELRQTQMRYRTLVEQLPLMTYVDEPTIDEDGFWKSSYVSPQIEAILGFTPEEWNAMPYSAHIHEDDRERVIAGHAEVYSTLCDYDDEYRLVHKDGSTVWVRDAMTFVRDDSGEALYAQGYTVDITKQKTYEQELDRLLARERAQNEELRELDRLKDEFVALVSHELRTPLTSIRGYLELVLDGQAGKVNDQQLQFLGVVERNADRLQRLVGDLLFIAQVDAGRLTLELERTDAVRIAREAIEAASPIAADKDVELRLDAHDGALLVGDRSRLAQLIDNLVSNAIKFTPAGGRVLVRVASTPTGVTIEVADTGMGIPADEQARLFQRFFRTAAASSQAIPGTGLGLAISKAIVDAHEGAIAVTSEEGHGTTFRVSIPTQVDSIEVAA